MNEPDRKYRCIVCGDRTHMPIAAALEHFKLYQSGQWCWLKGNVAMTGQWSGFWSTCYLAFPILNTLRFWKYRKATLTLADRKPLEAAFDANGCAIRQAVVRDSKRLTQELSLAEEALANYAQEVQRLQRALNFWLPTMPVRIDETSELYERLGDDIALLVGYDGKMEAEAEDRGWITLNAVPTPAGKEP